MSHQHLLLEEYGETPEEGALKGVLLDQLVKNAVVLKLSNVLPTNQPMIMSKLQIMSGNEKECVEGKMKI
ncbi:hypothetical protein HOLleu_12805 [Holothuria leucospilota]|uniref:Uncharacterized protein n=1 Tax=Holothuria leucospilota TaxID=206669 RepID=A0A9Q1HE66_HOLLE|nr:hypothetical protein HOLleu_12805 [Holothuria leucospilota]